MHQCERSFAASTLRRLLLSLAREPLSDRSAAHLLLDLVLIPVHRDGRYDVHNEDIERLEAEMGTLLVDAFSAFGGFDAADKGVAVGLAGCWAVNVLDRDNFKGDMCLCDGAQEGPDSRQSLVAAQGVSLGHQSLEEDRNLVDTQTLKMCSVLLLLQEILICSGMLSAGVTQIRDNTTYL